MTVAVRRVGLSAAGVAAIYGFALLLVGSAAFAGAPEVMGVGLTIDLTLTATALVYFLAVRPGHLPKVALLPVFAGGVLTARLILPVEGRAAVAVAGGALVAVELGVATLLVWRLRKVIARTREARAAGAPWRIALETGLEAALGSSRIAGFLATELAILAAALTGWLRRAPRDAGDFFAVHRRRAWPAIAAIFAFLLIVESAIVHLLVARVSAVVAWILTASSIYALAWISGDAHALRLGGLVVTPRHLEVTIGLRWHAHIPRALIRSVTRIDAKLPRSHDLAACELLWPNVLVELHEAIEVRAPLGARRRVTRFTFSCDRDADLLARLRPLPEPTAAL
jgi:hypothetical protein